MDALLAGLLITLIVLPLALSALGYGPVSSALRRELAQLEEEPHG